MRNHEHYLKFYRMTLLFFLRHSQRKQKPSTIYCLISVNGLRAVPFTTNEKVFPDRWDNNKQRVKGNDQQASSTNAKLGQIQHTIKSLEFDLSNKKQLVTADRLKRLFLGEDKLTYQFIEVSEKFLTHFVLNNKKSTVKNVASRLRNAERFLIDIKRKDMLCSEFTLNISRQFTDWLKSVRNVGQNHAIKNQLAVRQVLNFALEREYIDKHPLPALKMKSEKIKPIVYLEPEELGRLERYSFANSHLSRVRDVFIFCCHTGLAYVDVRRFHRKLHTKMSGHRLVIDMFRGKTHAHFSVPLSEEALDILRIYGDRLLVISNQKMNTYLKEIGQVTGIEKPLTTHVARKTAGMLWLNNGISLPVVAAMLGDTVTITSRHYAKILERKIVEEMIDYSHHDKLVNYD
jgi:integrase/recombinase XerD